MNSTLNEATKRIGELIKSNRKKKKITQSQLAEGICSQSVISSIESGYDMPNVFLFYQICKKLDLPLTDSFIQEILGFDRSNKFAEHVFQLCKNHQYDEIIEYMDSSKILDDLESDRDFQTYYYYYACALYQTKKNFLDVERYLKLAIACTMKKPYKPGNEIEILLINALGVLNLEFGFFEKSFDYFDIAYNAFLECTENTENLNVISYQYGTFLFKQERYMDSLSVLLNGFDDVINKRSFFMLAEYSLLISNCYQKIGDSEEAKKYYDKYGAFMDL
ncbi:MAG: helix-turn-helix domain-containing protein [Leuconostoc lactis]|uniref:helix-turn-helix domain-containing protein n=1 Tax=Leuconostoc lactis TaxID=1246 RepID=UPI0039935FBC